MKPVSKTAFYCTGVRALDARQARPACGDQYAERFMDDAAWQAFEPFRKFRAPNTSNATRHRIIDDLLRERLAANANLLVAIVGAGFDSRAFRLEGGRWVEVDEPQIMAWKEPRLPVAQCPNPLTRLAVDFGVEKLAERLQPFAEPGPVAVVVEGVLFYLPEERLRELLRTIRAAFPKVELICDVMTVEFFNRYGREIFSRVRDMGAELVLPRQPLATTLADEGFTETARICTIDRARDLGQMSWGMGLLTRVLPGFNGGYTIRVFTSGGGLLHAGATEATGLPKGRSRR